MITQTHRHYTLATRYIESQDYSAVFEEIHKATRLCVDDQGLSKTVDNLFRQLNITTPPLAASPTVEEIVTLIQKLPDNESAVLGTWLDHQKLIREESETDIVPIQPQVKASGSYRMVIEEASPEFLLDQVPY